MSAIVRASRAAARRDNAKAKSKGAKKTGFEVADEHAGAGSAVQATMGIVDEDEARDKAKKKKTSSVSLSERLRKQEKRGKGDKAGGSKRRGEYAAKEMEYMPRKSAR